MNDPGLDEPLGDADDQVNEIHPEQNKEEIDGGEVENQSFLAPARWWYASTAVPMMAGTFGPMANAFSICALVENWRVEIPPGGTEQHGIDIKDPKWLIAVNAVSLACALIANMALLLNMARRVPFHIAQPITILGFWIASILLIGLIAKASTDFHAADVKDQALTQAYYYAIFAAGLYQIISYLMCITVYGAWRGHYSKEFKLTAAQRTLMLQTISFLVYQLVWALAYSHIEGWKFLDAVYWSDFTSLTIGIGGSYTPKTHLGRSLLFPFALGGIVILGLVIGSIRSLVLERGKKKMAARMTEKTRRRLIGRINKAREAENTKRLAVHGMKTDMARALTMKPGDDKMAERDRREYEFEAMRRIQDLAAQKRKYISLFASAFAFAFLWTMGAFVFYKSEKNQQWSYFQAFYFSYTTLLTIGYGDFEPMSNSGKPFFVFWSLLAVPTLTILISNMGDTVVKGVKDATIYIGEITVLPSNEAGVRDRLKYGFHKALLGKLQAPKKVGHVEDGAGEDDQPFQELHPGIAKVFGQRASNKLNKKAQATGDRLASDFEKEEKIGEEEAKEEGDKPAEDEHHNRRILLSQIRKVYSDSMQSTPKKYTYKEWKYFLELLGEDESDSTLHKVATKKPEVAPCRQQNHDDARGSSSIDGEKPDAQAEMQGNGESPSQWEEHAGEKKHHGPWSWIGDRSPLMCDQEESEWLLERFFIKLEESLRNSNVGQTQQEGTGKKTSSQQTLSGDNGQLTQRKLSDHSDR